MRPALPDRFTPCRVLGTGSFGDVWLAADSVRGADVAVKRLRHATGRTVGLFKEEFRRVADISHPNVVSLYELIPLEGEWFLTMEPILGTTPRGPVAWSDALPGIIAGLDALHTRGRLHRDIKASNILVDDDGRAVILDFGLNTQLGAASRVRGNLDAAAPEEVAGRPLGRASDFYALGATIARDLTGGSVFHGAGAEVLAQKLRHDAPPLAERVPELVAAHPDLAALVDAMLVRSPSERLAAMETPARALGCAPRTSRASWKLVGRKRERASLDAALKRARAGESVHVRIEGPPAIGKTALVNAWLDEPQETRDQRDFVTTCFDGRCVNLDHSDHRGLDDIVRALLAFYGEDGDRSSPSVSLRQLLAGGDEHAGDELVPRTRS